MVFSVFLRVAVSVCCALECVCVCAVVKCMHVFRGISVWCVSVLCVCRCVCDCEVHVWWACVIVYARVCACVRGCMCVWLHERVGVIVVAAVLVVAGVFAVVVACGGRLALLIGLRLCVCVCCVYVPPR